MLRLWRDLYRIVLHPNRVSLVRLHKAHFSKSKPLSVDKKIEPGANPSWKGAVDQLAQIVSEMGAIRADVEIVLSNHFARYAVIPWDSELMATDETEMMARIRFEEMYGNLPLDWDIQFSEAGYGEAQIACAVDSELLQQISGLFSATSLRVVSIQPYLMVAFNYFRPLIPDDDFLLLLNEPGRLGMVWVRNRQWFHIRQVQIGNLQDELPGLLRREVLVGGMENSVNQYVFELDDLREGMPHQIVSKSTVNQQSVAVGENR